MTYNELRGWVSSACADMSMNTGSLGEYDECEADRLFDDAETIADVVGDHIYHEPNRDDLLCEMLDDSDNMRKAAELIIEGMPLRKVKGGSK